MIYAVGRGDGETRHGLWFVGVVAAVRVGDGRGVARGHERGAEALLHHCSCVAVVMRGTGGRRAGGGGLGVDDVASDGFSTQFERCTAQIRALLGALAVQLLHDVGEEASRGRRLAPRLVPPKGPGVILFGAVNRSVGICF